MLKVARILRGLEDEDRYAVAWEAYRTFGGPLSNAQRASRYRDGQKLKHRHEVVTEHRHEVVTNEQDVVLEVSKDSSKEPASKNGHYVKETTEILNFLNEKTGRSFRTVKINLNLIEARLKSGASVEDCRGVIARKVRQWKGTEMEKYLRPKTLFGPENFEQYIGEQKRDG